MSDRLRTKGFSFQCGVATVARRWIESQAIDYEKLAFLILRKVKKQDQAQQPWIVGFFVQLVPKCKSRVDERLGT